MHVTITTQMKVWLYRRIEQVIWELSCWRRTYARRFGNWGWGMLMLLVVAALAGWVIYDKKEESQVLVMRLAKHGKSKASSYTSQSTHTDVSTHSDDLAGLKAFEAHLLPHEEIPVVVQDVLRLAGDEGLAIKRGEYQPQIDPIGGFMRYRMSLPVQGAAPAIHRFIESALYAHKTLALESIQFKRERIESAEIDARIQWIVLARQPETGAPVVRASETATGNNQ